MKMCNSKNVISGMVKQNRIRFEDIGGSIPFDGTPLVAVATATKDGMFGRDKHRKKKYDKILERESELEVCFF